MNDLVKALGLKIFRADILGPDAFDVDMQDVVSVSDLRAALEKLPILYGKKCDKFYDFSETTHESDQIKARLLCVEEIKREPLKISTEVVMNESGIFEIGKSFVGKRVRVTVEEIK